MISVMDPNKKKNPNYNITPNKKSKKKKNEFF